MIPAAAITHWSRGAPWPPRDQVEQDLVLSRLICEIVNHEVLGDELVFRGGTCLHKVHLPHSLRYSEDLDYVRATDGPIGPYFDALSDLKERFLSTLRRPFGPAPSGVESVSRWRMRPIGRSRRMAPPVGGDGRAVKAGRRPPVGEALRARSIAAGTLDEERPPGPFLWALLPWRLIDEGGW
ncbi:MAG: nucleotidyl transferase AbiEii/AbiGii toxin family protein [Actinomycetota bacterium]|nr:nucleotidyl transferase AbiEii/AbiGii toxin family protein [Actinomycetota bacterium]